MQLESNRSTTGPLELRPVLWEVKAAIKEMLSGSNTLSPFVGFSHKHKAAYVVSGAVKYFLTWVLHQPFVVPGQNLLFARLPASIGIEGVIKELDYELGLPRLCCKKFWATEAALSLAVLTYNLNILFQRHLGWMERVNVATLRYRLFQNAGLISLAKV